MQVFKAYFLIILRNIPQMIIFLTIFLALSIAFANMGVGNITSEFEESKPSIALFVEDESEISKAFAEYLSSKSNVKSIPDDESALRDALFFGDITYIIRIPEGFVASLTSDEPIQLVREAAPDSIYAAYLDNIADSYFRHAKAYLLFLPELTAEEMIGKIENDIAVETKVTLTVKPTEARTRLSNSVYFFNYFAYSLFAIILHGVCSFMVTFNEIELRKRNTASPMKPFNISLQLFAANAVFALGVWLIMFTAAFLLFGKDLINNVALYYGANTLVYTIVCVAISFAVGTLIKGKGAQAAVVNILSLGLSFLTGVFVPQEMLSASVLKIGSFTPTYWFVLANRKINFYGTDLDLFQGVITKELLIQLMFIILLFSVAVLIRKKRNVPGRVVLRKFAGGRK